MSKVVALIDGDSIAYRAAAAVEKTKYLCTKVLDLTEPPDMVYPENWKETREWDEKGYFTWSRREVGTLEEAKTICDSFVRKIRENTSNDYSLFLTPTSGNFRDSLAKHTRYKGSRDGVVRPIYLADIREYLCDTHSGVVVTGHEAEDEVSIEACKLGQDNYIIVGNDKDLLQIPGRHYNWVKDESFDVTPLEAWDALWMQVLMGDRVDNIPGCWGMGFQKAKNRVVQWNAHKEFMIEIVHAEYEKSKKVKGCPYKDESEEDTYRRVYETYWLVKLKEYADEAPWYPKIKNKKTVVVDGKTKASGDTDTSSSARSATDSAQSKPITAQQQTNPALANGATGSE